MLLKDNLISTGSRQAADIDQFRHTAAQLREEFGVPFAFLDPITGEEIWNAGEAGAVALGRGLRTLPQHLAKLRADARAHVHQEGQGRYQLLMPLFESGRLALVACGEVAALSAGSTPQAACERERLQKWLQAVSDRLRLNDGQVERRPEAEDPTQNSVTWEAILTLDHLIRRLRIHKEPAKNQQRILDGAFRMLRAQSLIWVPQQSDASILVQGEPLLSPPECRALAAALSQHPDYRPHEPLICNDPRAPAWNQRFPQVNNLLAFMLTDQGPAGWVIALNKRPGRGHPPVENRSSEATAPRGFRK